MAHAFYPRDGRVHFDVDEKWSIGKSDGANFEMIATHEFGHSIGESEMSLMLVYANKTE